MKQTLEYLESFAVMALMAIGLTGACYHLFREGGWLDAASGSLVKFTMDSPVMAVAAISGAIAITCTWRQSLKFQRQNGKAATLVFYIMLAAGAYFLGRLAVVGTL